MKKTHKLSTKTLLRYDRFAREYLKDMNGTRAATAAGYAPKAARTAASQLLANTNVQALVAKYSQKAAQKLEITAEKVLGELAKLAFFDARKFVDAQGHAIPIHELDDVTAAALAGFEISEEYVGSGKNRHFVGYSRKFRLADRGMNLERLGRHLKLFTDRIEVGPDLLLAWGKGIDERSAVIGPPEGHTEDERPKGS